MRVTTSSRWAGSALCIDQVIWSSVRNRLPLLQMPVTGVDGLARLRMLGQELA
jgi:hypothetical protein